MTGQAGITIDIDLDMTIDAIKYVDQDGDTTGAGAQGAITMKGLTIDNDGGAARIRGITIDVDGTDGLVMGLNQIGDTLGNGIDISIDSIMINGGDANLALFNAGVSKANAAAATVAFASDSGVQTDLATYFADPAKANWTALSAEEQEQFAGAVSVGAYAPTGANTVALLGTMSTEVTNYKNAAAAQGVGDGNVGGFVIENFRNYIQDDLVGTYNGVFDMALQDSTGTVVGTGGATGGRFVRGEIVINGTGNSIAGTGGVQISGEFGGAMDKLAWVDGYGVDTDTLTPDGVRDAGEFGVKDLGFFHGVDTDFDGISDTIEGMHFSVDIDVEDRLAWDATGADNVAALKISNISMTGTIMMGDIYLGSSTDTVSDRSLGSVLIKDIDMTGTSVYIYGH